MRNPLVLTAAAAMIWSAPATAQSPCHTSIAALSLALALQSERTHNSTLSLELYGASLRAKTALITLPRTRMMEVVLANIAAVMELDPATRRALTDATERVKTACDIP